MIVLDIVSNGRVSYVIGLGYRPEEYAMFGVDMSTRGKLMDRKIDVLQRALAGERFEYDGRTVHVTPSPVTPGGPRLAYGGHTVAAARRAGRLRSRPLRRGRRRAARRGLHGRGRRAGSRTGHRLRAHARRRHVRVRRRGPRPGVGRARAAPAARRAHVPRVDGRRRPRRRVAASATTEAELRAENGAYRILTVDEAIAQVRQGRPLSMQPLCGGIPPELAWKSVRLAGTAVQAELA